MRPLPIATTGPVALVLMASEIGSHADADAAAGDILNAVYSELNQYTQGQRSEDDITLVIVKIDGIG